MNDRRVKGRSLACLSAAAVAACSSVEESFTPEFLTPEIVTLSLPHAVVGRAYAAALTATKGNGDFTWTIVAGTLPEGLRLSTEGVVDGTPERAGSSSFAVQVSSAGLIATTELSIQVFDPLTIVTATLPDGAVDVPYGETLNATGGDGTYAWSLESGSLPAGISLTGAGLLSGLPRTPETADFEVHVESGDGQANTVALSITVVRLVTYERGESWNNVAPIGCGEDWRNQQLHSAQVFGETGEITAISFFQGGNAELPTATYTFNLSTTPRAMDGLSNTLDENLGADATVVFSQHIVGHKFFDKLTFTFDTPFHYDPSLGNLLLDLVVSDAVDGPCHAYVAMKNSPDVSRRPAWGGAGDRHGVKVAFVVSPRSSSVSSFR